MEEEKVIIKDMKETKRRYSFGLMAIVGIVVAGVLIGMGTSFFTVVAVKHTSDVNFCGSCHSMKPMAAAYRNSVHGGYGESGIMATCADCHLPHKSTAGYLVQKVKTGLWDVWVETTHDTSKIDWHEKREERRNWVYDSACLHCHENLLLGTRPNKKAFTAHKAYFAKKLVVSGDDGKKESAKCVDCHKHVGHYQLEKHLPPRPSEVMDEEENAEH
ncbi:MAG: NapC/NirT family cytochrome c [Sulfurimonas sp.]|uniref:cytochrome c3 family protein n=1 Tax=Sulfurimonas sp. TaxID=2022749 RepID=UPI0028CD8E9A|nr:NapC/NirT family cytochrome c [Sulfurimonas sp.]MDT8337679.1 NapC/NirT family cytochrome c [Sulfurimonas sp.]